jgi:hypothetical protein
VRDKQDQSSVKAVLGTILCALLTAAASCSTDTSSPDQGSAGSGGSASGAPGEPARAGSPGNELSEEEAQALRMRLVESCVRLCSLQIYLDNVTFVDGCEPGRHYRGGVLVGEDGAGGAGGAAGLTQDAFPTDPSCDCTADVPLACLRDAVELNECMVESDWVCGFANSTSVTVPACDEIAIRLGEEC